MTEASKLKDIGSSSENRRHPASLRSTRVLMFAALLLCASIGYIYHVGSVAIKTNHERTDELSDIENLDEFVSGIKDAETGQRGYLLTGEERYLEPYRIGLSRVQQDAQTLQHIADAGDLPRARVERVVTLMQQKLADLDRTIQEQRTHGPAAALVIVQSNEGENFMEQIRREVAAMKAAKEQQFAAAGHRADRAISIRNMTFIGVGLGNLLVLFWAAGRISREARKRDLAVLEISRQKERYQALFTSMDEGFCVIEVFFDADNRPIDYQFLEVNPAFEKHMGFKDVPGKRMREIAPNLEAYWFEIYGKVAITGESIRFERQARALDRWFDVYAFRVGRAEKRRVAILFTDITQRKKTAEDLTRMQAELERYAHDLEHQVAERTEHLQQTVADLEAFSYTVSHDLRAPLRAMQGFAQLLLAEYAEKLGERGRDFLRRISNSAVRLDQLILEVLTYSRIGRDERGFQPVDLDKLFNEVTTTHLSICESGAEIRVDHPLKTVVGSHAMLGQCISNLMTNAVKFVPKGAKPKVHVWTEVRDSQVRFSVEDEGIGIPQDLLSKIFEPFQRAHPYDGYEGTGMGLAIVHKAVQRMGGLLGVESTENRGTVFWIELPAAA